MCEQLDGCVSISHSLRFVDLVLTPALTAAWVGLVCFPSGFSALQLVLVLFVSLYILLAFLTLNPHTKFLHSISA